MRTTEEVRAFINNALDKQNETAALAAAQPEGPRRVYAEGVNDGVLLALERVRAFIDGTAAAQ